MFSENSPKATPWLNEPSLSCCRIPSPARSFVVPSSRVWCTGSTHPSPGSLCSPGSTLRGALLGRAPHGHKMQRCSRVSWVNGKSSWNWIPFIVCHSTHSYSVNYLSLLCDLLELGLLAAVSQTQHWHTRPAAETKKDNFWYFPKTPFF